MGEAVGRKRWLMAEPTGHLQSEQPQLTKLRSFANRLDGSYPLPREKKIGRQKQELNWKAHLQTKHVRFESKQPASADWLFDYSPVAQSPTKQTARLLVQSPSALSRLLGLSTLNSSPVPLPLPSLPSPSPPVNKHTDDDVIAATVICWWQTLMPPLRGTCNLSGKE